MTSYTRRVNYYETDQMGVVHHSNYIRYFEEARTDFMEKVGYPYALMEERGLIGPVVSMECRYRKSVRYGESIDVHVKLVKMERVRWTFTYEVVEHETGELRATGRSEHCFTDRNGRIVSLARMDPEMNAAFEKAADLE